MFPFKFPYTGLKSPNRPQYVKHRGGQRRLDKRISLFLFKWSDSDRQGGPAPPEYLLRKHCNFESFQKKEIGDTDCIYCMLTFCSLSIFQSLFLKAQSVYTWIRISLNGIVPPFPFCFILFIIMATDPSDVFFILTTHFLHRQISHCHCSIYSSMHFLLVLVSGGSKAARMASSNTFLSPRWLKRKKKKTE